MSSLKLRQSSLGQSAEEEVDREREDEGDAPDEMDEMVEA
jgi:hypothetical protein